MATEPTNNAVPSEAYDDLRANSGLLDKFINSNDPTYTDRLGQEKKTAVGIAADVSVDVGGISAEVIAARDETLAAQTTVQSLADSVTTAAAAKLVTTITASDPDGTIAGLAATTDGQAFYVAQGTAANIAMILYKNVAGVAVPESNLAGKAAVDAVAASVVNIQPLNNQAKYLTLGTVGSEYEFNSGYAELQIDSKFNIIKQTRNFNTSFLLPIFSPSATFGQASINQLSINGTVIDPSAIPPTSFVANLTPLSAAVSYMAANVFASGGEYEFNSGFTSALLDSNKNIISYIKNGVLLTLLDSIFQNIKAKTINADVINIGGVAVVPGVVIPNDDYIGFSQSLGGTEQIYAIEKNTSKQIRVTNNSSNETNPIVKQSQIIWTTDRASAPLGNMMYANLPDVTEHAVMPYNCICGWGDSFMDNNAFLNYIYQLTGLPTYNFGKSSLRSNGVAALQGGEQTKYQPVGGVIPATGSVQLTPSVPGPAANYSGGALSIPPVNFGGVAGTCVWDGTAMTFTRTTDGAAVTITADTPLYCYPYTRAPVTGSIQAGVRYDLHRESINFIWMGRNNVGQLDLVMQNMTNMIDYIQNLSKKIIILPVFNIAGETSGTSAYSQVIALNAAMKAKYPQFYCEVGGVDLRANFILNGNTAYDGDVTDMSQDVPPRTLKYDGTHPSQSITNSQIYASNPSAVLKIGAQVNANYVYQYLTQVKGWL